jgi:hypothetical protein
LPWKWLSAVAAALAIAALLSSIPFRGPDQPGPASIAGEPLNLKLESSLGTLRQ